jgi:hypothetical protein
VPAACTLLALARSTRDAHAYIPNVRDQHQSLITDLFTAVFNLLIVWVDGASKR